MTRRKTRFERITPPAPKTPKVRKSRPPFNPDWWLDEARHWASFPFMVEVPETPETDEEETSVLEEAKEAKPTPKVRRELRAYDLHSIMKAAMENGLQQAYLSGVAEVMRQVDIIMYIVKVHAPKNEKLQKELSQFVARYKKDIAIGRKHV